MRRSIIVFALLALAVCGKAYGQYYNTGQSPASQRWSRLGSDSLKMIYPTDFEWQARRTLFYMQSAKPYVNYGYRHQPLKTPVIFKTENFFSNGLGMLAPKRIEMVGVPAIDTYAEPWLKHLSVHEYRHMVQYGNINRSTVKVFSWLLGQQAPLIATGFMPFWFIEGDAVMLETQMSSFGRALQPSFTMHYRALGDEILRKRNPDKWFCGSFVDYVPSHYELGYQIVNYADKKYESYLGEGLTKFTSRYPMLIFTTQLALHNYYGTYTKPLFRETFTDLNNLWKSLPQVNNSAKIVSRPVKRYTKYSYPLYLNEEKLLVLRSDLDRTSRFVEIDIATGSERVLCHTGQVSSRPVLHDGMIMWTEYRQSTFWEQKVNSRVCAMKVGEWTPRVEKLYGNTALYPVDMGNGLTAFVNYHYDGHYSIDIYAPELRNTGLDKPLLNSVSFPKSVSLHGLAWDDTTQCLYYIALSDDGMGVGGLRNPQGRIEKFDVKAPSYVTIGDLSAADGMIYFNSIYSGKDEVHTMDVASGEEYRISQSRYGTFSASPSPKGEFVAVTTYERDGYKAAVQEVEYWDEVEWHATPKNVVNATVKQWDVPSMDDIVFTQEQENTSKSRYKAKRYRKGLNIFNFHSWAPIYYVPEELMSGGLPTVHIGANLMSQNLLSTTQTEFGYGYSLDGYSLVRGRFSYMGWAPKIDITAQWSDYRHSVYNIATGFRWTAGSTVRVNARVSLPMLLSSGYFIQSLAPSILYQFNNDEYIHPQTNKRERSHIGLGSVQYSGYVRRASLDLQPRLGYTLRASYAGNPVSDLLSSAWSVYGRVYTPGLLPHHGLTLAATYQKAVDHPFAMNVIDFQPRGYKAIHPLKYFAASANYIFPIAYPDWGWSGIFFLKRIYMSIGYEYAKYTTYTQSVFPELVTNTIDTYGGSVYLDIAPFRMPSQATVTLKAGLYKPKGESLFFEFGLSIPL